MSVTTLADFLGRHGLLPTVAQDVAESICASSAAVAELRMLSGELVLALPRKDEGLHDPEG